MAEVNILMGYKIAQAKVFQAIHRGSP